MPDIVDMIRARLSGDGGDRLIRFKGEWLSRSWLRERVASIQKSIDGLGLPPGAPIGIAPQNRPEFVATILALIGRRQPIVMIYAYQSGQALGRKLGELRLPAAIAASEQWNGPMLDAARQSGTAAIAVDRENVDTRAPYRELPQRPHRSPPEKPGIELLTSGTTGPPKQFAIDYERLFSRMVLQNSARTEERKQALIFFPLGNISGIYLLLPSIAADDQIVLLEKFNVPDWLEFVRAARPATANLPPAAFRMLIDAQVDTSALDCLQFIMTGAATLDPSLRREFESRYDVAILQAYGATEFGGIVTLVTPQHLQQFGRTKSDSVGRPTGGAQCRIVDVDGGQVLAAGQEGRIEVLAPAMSDAWISTTDLGLIDEDGFLYHRGRLDGAIMRGGFKIMPEQIAEALAAHPAVANASVVGLPDPRLGEVPAAAVELRKTGEPATSSELEAHLRGRLPATMLPTRYLFVDSLPRTPSLKVDVAAVRALLQGEAMLEGS